MRILCVSAQKPDSTGSGVYLAETVKGFLSSGHNVAVIAGIDGDDQPQLPQGAQFYPVYFRTEELPFPVCGMSDEMPYEAARMPKNGLSAQALQHLSWHAVADRIIAAGTQFPT